MNRVDLKNLNKLQFNVGDKVMCKNSLVTIVSRVGYDHETPYRIKFGNGRQIQVAESMLRKVGN